MKKLLLSLLLLFVATPVFAKLNCDQVTCDEARKYSYMDADKDGYYCEKQCGLYNPSVKKPAPKPSKTTTTKSKYILGPKGGCYYLNSKSKKVYVDKKYCK